MEVGYNIKNAVGMLAVFLLLSTSGPLRAGCTYAPGQAGTNGPAMDCCMQQHVTGH